MPSPSVALLRFSIRQQPGTGGLACPIVQSVPHWASRDEKQRFVHSGLGSRQHAVGHWLSSDLVRAMFFLSVGRSIVTTSRGKSAGQLRVRVGDAA